MRKNGWVGRSSDYRGCLRPNNAMRWIIARPSAVINDASGQLGTSDNVPTAEQCDTRGGLIGRIQTCQETGLTGQAAFLPRGC